MMMPEVEWSGPAPPERVGARLAAAKIEVRPRRAIAGAPLVICTQRATRVPSPVGGRRWIWASLSPIAERLRVDAVLRGAYEAISLRDPDGGDQLAARLTELLVAEPVVPESDTLVAHSAASRRLIVQVMQVAGTSMPVLLTGETGTGKEVMARLIHAWSPRHPRRFVPINCAAIPNELMEAELFGYARGAFSGAVQRYDGQLMAAEGGTVFLDEIDDTPLETQVKLLRVLEDRVVSRLGENVWHEVDFRILAATNRDLKPLVEAGLFGIDLYERLAIVTIQLPPLRERLEDLELLALFFMRRFAREQARPAVERIRPDAIRALEAYPWPGNIRELRNVIYQALVYKRAGQEIILADLPRRVLRADGAAERRAVVDRGRIAERIQSGTMVLRDEVASLERAAVEEALKRAGGNAAQAARLLGRVGRGSSRDPGGTLRAMMRRLGTRA
jgi:DNA-binding NtrC family response regulator